MKKALAVLLAGVLGCSVCGCGTKDDNKEQEEPKEKMEEVVLYWMPPYYTVVFLILH